MPLHNPVQRTEFAFGLKVASVSPTMAPRSLTQVSGTRGGIVRQSEVSPPLWEARFNLAVMRSAEADGVAAILAQLERPGWHFFVSHPHRVGPANDPTGAILSPLSLTLAAVTAPGDTLSIAGMPPGFSVAAGDLLSFTYGTPISRALHRVTFGALADGSGTAAVTVDPPIRPGAVPGTSVEMVQPYCRAVVVPGSVDYGENIGGKVFGMAFSWRQTLKA